MDAILSILRQRDDNGERRVLEEFFSSLGAALWRRKDNWLSPLPLDQWHGVTVDDQGCVTGIIHEDNNVGGR